MFYSGDHELRAIEEENLRWRRRILGGFLYRLGRGAGRLLLCAAMPAIRGRSRVNRDDRTGCSLRGTS